MFEHFSTRIRVLQGQFIAHELLPFAHALAFVAMDKPQIAIWPWSDLFLER
jgi:hypothetical protein